MITVEQKTEAQRRAAILLRTAGLALAANEEAGIEVADFGLGNLEREGAQILTLVQTERISAKAIAMTASQTLPEHWHPPMGTDLGKEETVRVQWGTVFFFTEGPETLQSGVIPVGKEEVYTMRHETVMRPGDQLYCRPAQKHWFQAGEEGAVLFSFSSAARDILDMFTDPAVGRVTLVKGN